MLIGKKLRAHIRDNQLRVDVLNIGFLGFINLAAMVVAPIYLSSIAWSWGPVICAVVLYWCTGIGITMGYHRLYSHRSFKANWFIESILLIFGSMAVQNTALKWSSDHRKHHQHTDTPKDPYNAKLGFWWSHILWIFFAKKQDSQASMGRMFYLPVADLKEQFPNSIDLIKNPRVRLQHMVGTPVGFVLTLLVPGLCGHFLGADIFAYVLVGGFVRVACVHHSTFFINSLAHIWGRQPHGDANSSKDSGIVAIFSFGEGYHNYHHSFPSDYRNGIKLYHFDPTKWLIKLCSFFGWTWDLKVIKYPRHGLQTA